MTKDNRFAYFVEGETEKRLIEVLKTDLQVIRPGKVRKLNVVQQNITRRDLLQYPEKTILVFLFDTDTENVENLKANISFSGRMPNIKRVLCIPQVRNMEEELQYSCINIRDVTEITQSRSRSDFKRDFLKEKILSQNLTNRDLQLKDCGLEIQMVYFESLKMIQI